MTTDLTFFTNKPDAALLDRFKATLRDVQFLTSSCQPLFVDLDLRCRALGQTRSTQVPGTCTTIEWTESTWNLLTGCTKVSPGCQHCYAERMAKRLQATGTPGGSPARWASPTTPTASA